MIIWKLGDVLQGTEKTQISCGRFRMTGNLAARWPFYVMVNQAQDIYVCLIVSHPTSDKIAERSLRQLIVTWHPAGSDRLSVPPPPPFVSAKKKRSAAAASIQKQPPPTPDITCLECN